MDRIDDHVRTTKELALAIDTNDLFKWLITEGYYPENYVVPPCFKVCKIPNKKRYYKTNKTRKGTNFKVPFSEIIKLHFPKTELTDRTFGVIDPYLHNDIAYDISTNWKTIANNIFHKDNDVACFSFPIPVSKKIPGRVGVLRGGRMIYEFIEMIDNAIASTAYEYKYILKTDVKGFYPSIYTHSIAWAIHGKNRIKKNNNRSDYSLVGNRLDKLFQKSNNDCTNGIPIGPAVSDIIGELVASAVDRLYSKGCRKDGIDVRTVRFKDDYRILAKNEGDAIKACKILQIALSEYNLELSDSKTEIFELPDGLFRKWTSMYHSAYPKKLDKLTWQQFRELYLAVIDIDKRCPSTGVIDRFLADVIQKNGYPKVNLEEENLQKVISMLLMLATKRHKSFPKILAILESILNNSIWFNHKKMIINYIINYLETLSKEESRNRYQISWIAYFLVSNDYKKYVNFQPNFKDPIVKSVFNSRNHIFNKQKDYKLFIGCKTVSKKISMTEHLDIFNPPSGS